MNWPVDWAWWAKDRREKALSNRIQAFFESKGIKSYNGLFTLDGKPFDKDHSAGIVAMNAVASLAATKHRAKLFVEDLWNAPVRADDWRYYDGMLHCSGDFRIWTPQ
jgi:oligosaccharide reducing-end xylanase